MSHPGPEPAEFVVVPMNAADECHITVLLRNGRVRQVGGTAERPVLIRSFIDGEEWRAVVDELLHALHDQVADLSIRFVGEGFDPNMYRPDDKEALDAAETQAVVVSVPPDGEPDVRRVVSELAVRRELQATWLLATPATDPAVRIPAAARQPTPPPTRAELSEADCWFSSDAIARDPAATDFRRRARLHQARWRQGRGLPVGSEPYGGGLRSRPVGSRIERSAAIETGANFVTRTALAAVQHRLSYSEENQMLREDRLWCDLLSSMPLCFNVFGPVAGDLTAADRAVHAWWPDTPGRVSSVRFEWSPGRLDPHYLGNRSAFDVAFLLALPDGRRGVIGVETKYHEHPKAPDHPAAGDRLVRYLEVSERSGVFTVDPQQQLVGADLEQLWLDHLLTLSMLQHPDGEWGWVRFVVVHPTHNPGFTDAVARYWQTIEGDTFGVTTLEDLLDNEEALGPPERISLRERYLF